MFKVFRSSAIESNYSVSTNPLFVSDPWTVYPAKHKVSKKNCSVFSFSKKSFESSMLRQGLLDRSNKTVFLEDCYRTLESYITNLSRFKHPNILTVLEPLEDHKSRMLFVTEYVTNDLSNFPKHELDEIIISKGLLQVAQGLKFLHQNAHMVHLNIQPSAVFINESFDWKLSGFNFAKPETTEEYFVDRPDARLPQFLGVNLCFTSPEVVLSHRLSYNADLFSLGCLIYYLFNARADSESNLLLQYDGNSLSSYERSFNKLKTAINGQRTVPGVQTLFRNIPQNYLEMFVRLVSLYETANDTIDLGNRLTIDEVIESKIFNNELIKILNVIDEFQTMGVSEKVQFFRELKKHINAFPKPLIINKFLPVLTDVLLVYVPGDTKKKSQQSQITPNDEILISAVLDNLLLMSKDLSKLTFSDKVFSYLQKLLKLDLSSCKLAMINNLSLIQDRLGLRASDSGKQTEQFASFLVQLFEKSVSVVSRQNQEQSLLQLQELALVNLPLFIQFQPYTTITNKIYPLLCDIFSTTVSLKVKNLTIKSFILLIGDGKRVNSKEDDKYLDNFLIIDRLLPVIQRTSVKNFKNSQILSNMVSLYHHIFLKLSSSVKIINTERNALLDIIMEQVLFELWKLSKFVHSKKNLDELFAIIKSVETFLVERSTEAVVKKEASSSALRSVTSNDEVEEEEEFGDFGTAVSPQNTPSFTPQPTFGAQPTYPAPAVSSPPMQAVQQLVQPVQPAKKTITLAPTKTSTTLGFGATSANSNRVSNIQTMHPMRPQTHTQTQTQTKPVQPVGIDWSKAASPSPQPTQPVQSSFTPINPQPVHSPIQPSFTPMNVMKPMVMQPTKKVNSPTPQSTYQNTTPNTNGTLFESLV